MATYTVTASQREANKKNNSSSSGSIGSSKNTVSYDPNVDYAAEIQKATLAGASQSVIDSLNAQRNAKIAGENLNYSSLTNDDIANYGVPRVEYDSSQVLGANGGNYDIANPTTKDWSNYASDIDYDARINALKATGADQATIDALESQKKYAEDVRNGVVTPKGYGEGMGYSGSKTMRYTFQLADGTTKDFSSNATDYRDAAKLAGIDLNDPNNKLLRSASYSSGSSAYSPKGYGFGVIGGPDDFTTELWVDSAPDRLYDMQNMQLGFLSGRDGINYLGNYENPSYKGNGINNAYNKGTQFAGQGDIMGGYNVNFQYPDGSTLNDVIAAYGQQEFAMPEIQGNFINPSTGANETYQDILNKYEDAIAQNNAAQNAYYKQQLDLANQQYDDTQRGNYINYMMAQRNLPAQLQAQGVNGGMAESTRSALESEYMSNYNQAEIARHNTSTEINVAAQQAAASNNMQAAEIYAGIAQSMLQYEQAEAHYQQQYQLSLMQMQQAQTQWEREFAYQQAQDAQAYALQAQQLASQERQLAIEYAYQVEDWNTYAQLTGMNTSNMQKKSNSVGSGSKGKSVPATKAYDLLDILKTKGQDAAFAEMEKWSKLDGYSDASIDATWEAVKELNGMNYQNIYDTSSEARIYKK